MSTYKEEINWYWNRRVYVYPFKSVTGDFNWLDWRNLNDAGYIDRLQEYNETDAIGLNLVCGKKGVCGIGIRRDENDRHSLEVLHTALGYLGLPKDCTWVIQTPHENIIIIDAQTGFNKKDQKKFENIRIIWESFIQLPVRGEVSSYPVQFIGFYPQEHPTQVSKDTIYKCITELSKKDILLPSKKSWWRRLFNM